MPEGLMKKKDLGEKIAKKVGDIIHVVVTDGKINSTSYLRARVWLDLNKPLVRMVPILLKERMKYLVQYEKLPNFCYFCGCMGHEVSECGDGIHPKESWGWGEWICVPFAALGIRRVVRGGRGRGRGRGRGVVGGRSGGTYDDYGEDPMSEEEEEADKDGDQRMTGALIPIGSTNIPPATNVSPLALQEKKRLRTSDQSVEGNDHTNARSALSFEESGRAQ